MVTKASANKTISLLDLCDYDGQCALHIACVAGQTDIVKYILETGKNIQIHIHVHIHIHHIHIHHIHVHILIHIHVFVFVLFLLFVLLLLLFEISLKLV